MLNPIVSFALISPETISVAPIIDLKNQSTIGFIIVLKIIVYFLLTLLMQKLNNLLYHDNLQKHLLI